MSNYSLSDPTPSGDPRKPRSAPSPPEDPPLVRLRLNGFDVRPNTWLKVSIHYINPRRSSCSAHAGGEYKYHQGLGNIGANKGDSPQLVQDFHEGCVTIRVLPNP